MSGVLHQAAVDGAGWVFRVFWSALLFYVPWRCFMVAEARIRVAVVRRRTAVDR